MINNRVIDTLTSFFFFTLRQFKAKNLWKIRCEKSDFPLSLNKRGEGGRGGGGGGRGGGGGGVVKRHLFIQGNIRESKNLPLESNREKYNLDCKPHIYKIKTIT